MKNSCSHILALVKKDLLLETRQQYTLYGIILYIASTIFVVYLAMGEPEEQTWNSLFWVIQLFVCINSVAKSFLQENRGRMLYFYSITSPKDFILGKLFFNTVLMILMSVISLLAFTVFLGNPLQNGMRFLFIACFGGVSLSLVFTFLSAIAAKAQQSAALMAIMGFPLIIPQLLLLSKIATSSFADVIQGGWWQMVLLLACFDVLVVVLAVILFPFLWKD